MKNGNTKRRYEVFWAGYCGALSDYNPVLGLHRASNEGPKADDAQ